MIQILSHRSGGVCDERARSIILNGSIYLLIKTQTTCDGLPKPLAQSSAHPAFIFRQFTESRKKFNENSSSIHHFIYGIISFPLESDSESVELITCDGIVTIKLVWKAQVLITTSTMPSRVSQMNQIRRSPSPLPRQKSKSREKIPRPLFSSSSNKSQIIIWLRRRLRDISS